MRFGNFIYAIFLLLTSFQGFFSLKTCIRKNYPGPEPRMVCVCNATYCDEFPPLGILNANEVAVYVTSISGKRFERSTRNFQNITNNSRAKTLTVEVLDWIAFQTNIGFGGAFTDSVGVNLNSLSMDARQNLLNSYFGNEGIGYTMGRVPMAGCDFSTRSYSYDDVVNDFELKYFNLTQEDHDLKIPNIKLANSLLNGTLKLFSSPWSAPGWMKTSNSMFGPGQGQIKGDIDGVYYEIWSRYFLRFFEEYDKNGLNFWGLTVQNEPFQSMYYSAEMQRDFVKGLLGPVLKNYTLTKDIKIMIFDDDRQNLPDFPMTILADSEASKYVDGTAVHWYDDLPWDPASKLSDLYLAHSDKFILSTEACNGWLDPPLQGPSYGNWFRGASYANDIIIDFQNFVSGWVDWNMCLDEHGGPTWVNNFLDSPIIVNKTVDEFYKQPMYYFLGHFSKFITPNATRIEMQIDGSDALTNSINGIAYILPPNEQRVLVLHNPMDVDYAVSIQDPFNYNKTLEISLEKLSIATFIFVSHGDVALFADATIADDYLWMRHLRTNF